MLRVEVDDLLLGRDVSGCRLCGNGIVESWEQCDGEELLGQDCQSLQEGYVGGVLRCSDYCQRDPSHCIRSIDYGTCPGIFAFNDTHIFHTEPDFGNLVRLGKDGTFRWIMVASTGSPRAIALGDTHVYWMDGFNDDLRRMPNGSITGPQVLASGLSNAYDLVLLGTEVFFIYDGDSTGAIDAVPRTGGAVRSVAMLAANTHQLAEFGGVLYANSLAANLNWTIRRVDPSTGQSTSLASFIGDVTDVSRMSVDSAFVYWGVQETAGFTTLYRVPNDGGTVTPLGEVDGEPRVTTVDDDFLYVITDTSLWKLPKAGGTPILITALDIPEVIQLAVDETHLYFSQCVFPRGLFRVGK